MLFAAAGAIAGDLNPVPATVAETTPVTAELPNLADRSLPDSYGNERLLAEFRDGPVLVVAVLGVECPLAKLYAPRLQELAEQYAAQGVRIIGVNANRQDTLAEIGAYARRHGVTFPLLKDNQGWLIDQLGATRTPEVFVLDRRGLVRYRGRIDDQYAVGVLRDAPEQHYLRDAIDALLSGNDPPIASTESVGCLIGARKVPDPTRGVTYTNQVARVLERHCVECHREGEIAPFALRGYDEVAGWADTIAEVVRDQRMPPWHADPAHGEFLNTRLMTDAEKQVLYDWAAAGAPEGAVADLPAERKFVTGWRLPRDPDKVIPMRGEPFVVAPQGVIEYQYFAVDPGFEEDRWIQAADVVPGDRSVVHHVIVFITPPADRPQRGMGMLTAFVPGQSSMVLPEGHARLVPAGSKFIFQMHYTPSGMEKSDLTQLGLVFADPESVTQEVLSLVSANPKFEIPPGAADYRVETSQDWFPPGAKLIGLAPHMHYRGKSFRMTGVWPDGRTDVLLDVPRYDFNWQTNYRLAEPLELPAGFRIESQASFDNSAANLANPDPTAAVRWGDQSFEEMAVGFFEIAVPRGSLEQLRARRSEASQEDRETARRLADNLFEQHDADKDGVLKRNELPLAFAIFAFKRFDFDNSRDLTPDEVFEAALANETRRF
ncbi:redoxin domain-containing protein [Botrimarina hoheduenensis]|uniref:Thiol-disulfide oxidoreductase n=1 Tax=Botrimarina hoheduenensis TaxID=2528000 RepID=A0A5C5W9G8_9BACT|nr:redoxin domain-containing protein [Botrimarina hoheduenensis]TWT47518.1 thiol-disulfide oxidoreductase [Botrimarina hoheduenensis]